jgi:parvulin-like peptidyl-prolyl isomerase
LILIFIGTSGCDRLPFWKKDTVDKKDAVETTGAVAVVDEELIGTDDLRWYLDSRSSGGGAALDSKGVRSRLQEMVIVKLLAQEAKKQNLAQDPSVKYGIEQMLGMRLLDSTIVHPTMSREISPEEIEAYFDDHRAEFEQPSQVRLADIFIAAPARESAEELGKKQERAEKILSDALKAEKERFGFSRLVQQFSDQHPSYPLGDTGYFNEAGSPSGIDPEMAKFAFTLEEKGKVVDRLVTTSNGFHVVMLVGRREAKKTEIGEVTALIEQRIRREEIKRTREQLIKTLTEKSSTKIVDEEFDKLAAKYMEENSNKLKGTTKGGVFQPSATK